MNKKQRLFILIIILDCFILTSCWDYRDIDKKSIVITVGVDTFNYPKKVEFSTEVAKLSTGAETAAGTAGIKGVYSDVSYGRTFEEARVEYNSKRPIPTFMGAARVVVFSTPYAKKIGLESYSNRINKIYDYRKNITLAVTKEPPAELLQFPIENDISVGFFIENCIGSLTKQGKAITTTAGDVLSYIAMGDVGYFIPYFGEKDEVVEYLGLCVFKENKMIDIIPLNKTSGIVYLLNKKPNLVEEVRSHKDDKNVLSFRVIPDQRKIKTYYDEKEKKIKIDISLDVDAELRYHYYIEKKDQKDVKILEQGISKKIQKDLNEIIKKSQMEYECDILQFSRYFRAQNASIYKEINWVEEYPKAEINVKVNSKIINESLFDSNAELMK